MTSRILSAFLVFTVVPGGALAEGTLSKACESNAGGRIESIERVYYPRYQQGGPGAVTVWFARKDLEAARWYLHPDSDKGFHTGGVRCSAADGKTAGYARLLQRFDAAETKVKEIESKKGITFKEVSQAPSPNHVVYVGKDGTEVKGSSNY